MKKCNRYKAVLYYTNGTIQYCTNNFHALNLIYYIHAKFEAHLTSLQKNNNGSQVSLAIIKW